MQNYAIGFDISSYQDHIPVGSFDFGIAKNDNMAERHIKSMQDRGITRTGLYGWMDELAEITAQVDNLISNASKWGVSFLADDDEQWWSDWTKYMGSLNHTYSGVVPALTPDHISKDFKQAAQLSHASGKPYVTYTAQWVEERAPLIASWVGSFDLWNACYFDRNVGGVYKVTWDQLIQITNNLDNLPALVAILNKTSAPYKIASPNIMPQGATAYKFRQFSSRIILPGESENVDLNIFNGTVEALDAWINGGTAPVPPAPIPSPIPQNLGKWIADKSDYVAPHIGPSVTYDYTQGLVSWPKRGDIFVGYQITGNWLKVDQFKDEWLCLSYLTKVS